jgi:hypothetical protein
MQHAMLACVVSFLLCLSQGLAARQGEAARAAADLVGTWTLATLERSVASGQPERIASPRGLLIVDAAGHAFDFYTSVSRQQPDSPQADPLRTFASYGGFWGRYRVDAANMRIVFQAEAGVSPSLSGRAFSRTFEWTGERLAMTSVDEPHAQGGTRWTWERVPTIDHLSPFYRHVVGFWQHIVERRVNLTTGAVLSETRRDPSVIIYTPSGFVGVHFPPLNRKAFAGDTPTAEEAASATKGYIGYYGALTVYPGQVFHNILAGLNPGGGTTLRRSVELSGNEVTVRLLPGANQQGQQVATLVTLRRLSGEADMLPSR